MKRIQLLTTLSVVLLSFCLEVKAQDTLIRDQNSYQTLLSKKSKIGGFIGLDASMALATEAITYGSAGATAAMTFNRNLAIGVHGTGYSSLNTIPYSTTDTSSYFFQGGYGGIYVEPILRPSNLVHVSFPMVIGGGSSAFFRYTDRMDTIWNEPFEYQETNYIGANAYVLFRPGVNVELNVARFMRIGLSASYPLTYELARYKVPSQPGIDGLNFGLNVKLGWF
jgi:hypothetical protein